jgi:hypothetical protein
MNFELEITKTKKATNYSNSTNVTLVKISGIRGL